MSTDSGRKRQGKGEGRHLSAPSRAVAKPAVEQYITVVQGPKDGRTSQEQTAEAVLQGVAPSAVTAMTYSNTTWAGLELVTCMKQLRDQVHDVNSGDLRTLEGMLVGQASALSSIFHECARRAALNMGQHMKATEQYMRLALKAQSQCRTTIETLAEIKNPRPVAFVKQANIANGHQQVNNGVASDPGPMRGEERPSAPNEILEGGNVARLDTRAPRASGGVDSTLEAVGKGNRAPHRRG